MAAIYLSILIYFIFVFILFYFFRPNIYFLIGLINVSITYFVVFFMFEEIMGLSPANYFEIGVSGGLVTLFFNLIFFGILSLALTLIGVIIVRKKVEYFKGSNLGSNDRSSL